MDTLKNLSYNEKRDLYAKTFSLGYFSSDNVNDKLILISLVSLMYLKIKEKNKVVTPLQLLLKITNQEKDNSAFYEVLENLSIVVEEFSYSCKIADSCGLKSSEEIINKIKEILSTWTPF
jgi:hypothetical protein